MLITLTRTYKTLNPVLGNGIFGNMVIDTHPFKCLTLERAGVEIPMGTYPLTWSWSEHFQQAMPYILVPNRYGIEIHWANWPKQLDGCIAVGTEEDLTADMLQESKIMWIAFVKVVLNQPNVMLKVAEDFGT